jgi:hypothetical protein
MTTQITEFDRTAFKGLKFEFICDSKFLTIAESPSQAINQFVKFYGFQPENVKQVSRYPARRTM